MAENWNLKFSIVTIKIDKRTKRIFAQITFMKKLYAIIYTLSIICFLSSCTTNTQNMSEKFDEKTPVALKKDTTLSTHGITRIDPYFWMNERDSKDVLAYISEENKYSSSYFKQNKSLTNLLLAEFERNIDPNQSYAPVQLNNKTYQSVDKEGEDYSTVYEINGNKKTVFIDENAYAKGASFYAMASFEPSPNNQLVALIEDVLGRNKWRIRFRAHDSETFLTDVIENTSGNAVWANDNATIFYVKKDPKTLREYQVFSHVLGTANASDKLVFQEDDEMFSVYVHKSISGGYIHVTSQSSTTSETSIISANNPTGKLTVFFPRKKDHIYAVEHHPMGWILLTNDHALNNRILYSKTIDQKLANWKEIIPHSADNLIENFTLTKDYLVTEERKNGVDNIRYIKISSGNSKMKSEFLNFKTNCYMLSMISSDNLDNNDLRYSYQSLNVPSKQFEINLDSKKQTTIFERKVPNPDFDSENYSAKRIMIKATDGTNIPVSIVYRKDIDLKTAPLIEYGYGSYGIIIPPSFSATRLSLLDRGFIFAIAHIRGGRDLGEDWYQNGKWLNKINTFTDFIDVGKGLSAAGYGDPKKQYANGGSAGGMLMGAVANMAPTQWRGIIADVPFVDVVTTMLDSSIPLTTGEYEEWGNPNNKSYFEYMLSYSPYDNVKKTNYPHMLINTGYHDSQVQYWEPLKWIAKLRALKTDNNLLLLQCNMDAGHGGGSGKTAERKEIATNFTFFLTLENIHE